MRRKAKIFGALLCLAAFAAPLAPAAKGPSPKGKLAWVKLTRCKHELTERSAAFYGRMRRVPGTERMWMRFVLQERVGDAGFKTIPAPGLGVWRKSRPNVRRFGYRQRLADLAPGAAYRVKVRYRWYAENGELIKRARRRSRVCRQPGRLPNLRIGRIRARQKAVGVQYVVQVVNRGRGPAGPFGVSLSVNGTPLPNRTVEGLAAAESRFLRFDGPACEDRVKAKADATDAVRETSELDNVANPACSRIKAR
jgi:CARDB protein